MRRAPPSLVLESVLCMKLYSKLLSVFFSTVEVLRLCSTPSFVNKL